jgi:TIR domain/SIR2-like domain
MPTPFGSNHRGKTLPSWLAVNYDNSFMPQEHKPLLDSPEAAPIHPRVWDIVDAIEREDEGEGVIPIVGQGLLVVQSGFDEGRAKQTAGASELFDSINHVIKNVPQPVELHALLAKIFASRLGLPNPFETSAAQLSNVVALHPQIDSNRYLVDTELKQIYSALDLEIPVSLRRLASIKKLNFFITTTSDDLLERALNQERFNGEPLTRILSFAPTRRPAEEKIAEAIGSGYPIVFHLFGRYKSPGCVALTESDYVDFIAALLDHEIRPRRLFSELKGKHLLLLGNSFHDWLARFFLRLTKDTPFVDQSGGVQYVADAELRRDKELAFFMRHCAKKAEPIVDIDPRTLILQLADSWTQRQEVRQSSARRTADMSDSVGTDWVFISYSRTDLGGAESADAERSKRLANDLKKEGFKVWRDISGGLRGGDDYSQKVQAAIARCGVFIPVCSKTTQMRADTAEERERPFFRREWNWALERLTEIEHNEPARKFVIPVVIDDLPFAASNVPERFKRLHASQLPEGVATPEFIEEIRKVVRSIKRREYASV